MLWCSGPQGRWAVPNPCWTQHGDVPSRWFFWVRIRQLCLFLETYCLGSCRCWYVYWVYPHSIIFNWYSTYWLVKYIHLSWAHCILPFCSSQKVRIFILKTAPSPQLDSPDNIMSAVDTKIFGPHLARSTLDGCMCIYIYIYIYTDRYVLYHWVFCHNFRIYHVLY